MYAVNFIKYVTLCFNRGYATIFYHGIGTYTDALVNNDKTH